MKKIVMMTIVFISSISFGAIWTETFDTGVGRLNQTTGPGDSYFTWDPGTQSIDGMFYRGHTYERYAPLGETFVAGDSVLGFSIVVTPLAGDIGYGGGIGFVNSDSINTDNRFTIVFDWDGGDRELRIASGVGEGADDVPVNFGTTYYIETLLNGPADTFSFEVYEGIDQNGIFLGSVSHPLGGLGATELDGLGFTNRLSWNGTYQAPIRLRMDNLSYTVPEPCSLALFSLGCLAIRRKRK